MTMKTARRIPLWQIFAAAIFLVIAILLIWRTSLTSATREQLKAIAARGEPVDVAALDKFYKHVPESENAALVWLAAVEATNPNPADSTDWSGIRLPRRGAPTD